MNPLRARVVALAGTREALTAACPRCEARWARFSDIGGTILAVCPEGCTGREILAALDLSLAELEANGARKAA